MPQQKFPHIFLSDYTQTQSYKPKTGGGSSEYSIPDKDPSTHGQFLAQVYTQALENYRLMCEQNGISPDEKRGVTIEVKSPNDISLEYSKLEDSRGKQKLEVLNVKFDENGNVLSALIYIPSDKIKNESLPKKIANYQDDTKRKKSTRELFNTVDNILAADLEAFWTDTFPFPQDNESHSWEVWLREGMFEEVCSAAESIEGITISNHHISFPERQICIAHCDLSGIQRLRLQTNALSGFRYNRVQSGFFDSLEPREQREWQDDLLNRLNYDLQNSSVCIMDTGLYGEHPLLRNAIQDGAIDTFHPDWGTDDHHGHGTEMAGLALVGDLTPILSNQQRYDVKHYLESIKVFPRIGKNHNDHIASITEQSVYRAETNFPSLNRVFCLSWTVSPEEIDQPIRYHQGQPSALSAKIDQLSFAADSSQDWGVDDIKKRLFFISAGNIQDKLQAEQYPDQNDLAEVEEPAQSWNAVTVGAYTNKVWVNDPSYDGWEPIAQPGELSPLSRTSVIWGKKSWPIKPDIVLEGGNYVINSHNPPMDPPDLHVLTTGKDTPFCHSSDTSAANAQAARLGAIIRAEYPNYWPETVRGLLVHAARWHPNMLQQAAVNPTQANMLQKIGLLRRYGYGVPDEELIVSSFSNQPQIVIQDYLRPFKIGVDKNEEPKSYASYNEMNFYALPWPKEELEQLFDARLKLRVTLSYFIEPNPSERPPKTKYSYASHDLRFKIQRAGEDHEQFLQRINAELAEDEGRENDPENEADAIEETSRGGDSWLLGPKVRDRGSVISDVWTGTATDLASQNMLAVIPQGGWWKHRLKFPDADSPRHKEKVRFALIISLECDQDVDIYTPITQKISTRTLIEV